MAKSGRVRFSDLRRAYRLIHDCRDLGRDPAAWPAVMAEGLTRLVDAEVASIGQVVDLEPPRTPRIIQRADCGWPLPIHREIYVDRYVAKGAFRDSLTFQRFPVSPGNPSLRTREQLVDDAEWYRSVEFNETHRLMEMDDILISLTRCGDPPRLEGFGLLRALGRRRFAARERRLVRLFHHELIGYFGTALLLDPEPDDPWRRLHRRLRETLERLLEGDSEKQVALRLGLSPHTVHQYVKAIHQRLGVSSRGELMALCLRPASRPPGKRS